MFVGARSEGAVHLEDPGSPGLFSGATSCPRMLERMTHDGRGKKKRQETLRQGEVKVGKRGEKEEEGRGRGSDWGVGRKGEKGLRKEKGEGERERGRR